jgi:hypothetical protein
MRLNLFLGSLVIASLATCQPASAQLSNYFQDFENLDRTDPQALENDGWRGAAAGISTGGGFVFFAGFAAANNISNPANSVISDFNSGGDPPIGDQGLVVFTDYGSDIHATDPATRNPAFEDLVISIFQERTIAASDIGSSIEFGWVAEQNSVPPSGNAFTEAFILTLDPNNGFAATNDLSFNTTGTPDTPTSNSLSLDLSDPLLAGQILQFGFRTTSSDSEGVAVDYDNVSLSVTAVPEPGSLVALALVTSACGLRRRRR